MKLLRHALLNDRTQRTIDDVAGNEYQVRMFCVNQVNPAGQLLAWVVVAYMQVAQHHYSVVLGQMLLRSQFQWYAYLIIIMDIAIEENAIDKHEDDSRGDTILVEPGARHKMDKASEVKHEEQQDEIEHDEDAAGAHLVAGLGYGQGQRVEAATEVKKQHHERAYQQDNSQAAPQRM